MDVTQALKDTENALRDFIALVLEKELGRDWVENCGVSKNRIDNWKDRKKIEEAKQQWGSIEERLIYYADFYDLRTILKKYWGQTFTKALGDWKTMEVWLLELEKFRDPDAHRRELLPHQKALVIGISGEIRSRLVRYRSKMETGEDYFPRIESVRDNYGNTWTAGDFGLFTTKTILRPNDILEFVVSARDPLEERLEYLISKQQRGLDEIWQEENSGQLRVQESDIGKMFQVGLRIRSGRRYHAEGDKDDSVYFLYTVLPART